MSTAFFGVIEVTGRTSWATSEATRRTMLANRGRDTAPEIALRSALHRAGARFRVDWPLPGMPRRRADVAFPRRRVAVFVDGCFWHGCPKHHVAPRANAGFWAEKVASNRRRDAETDRRLRALGWRVVRTWEHEDPERAARRVLRGLSGRLDRMDPRNCF
ncbi:MAG: very short patch repair endonuclease [Actinomycetota bacterium]